MIKLKLCSTILILSFTFLLSCSSKDNSTISQPDFISIYAKLSIINELSVDKAHHDKLVKELLFEFNIQLPDIQKSVEFYQKNPQQWIEILDKVKNEIAKYRKIEKSAEPRTKKQN